jgi:flagellar basal-body rod protein FlgG
MVTSSGYTIQPAITVPSNAQSVSIGADGTVSVSLPGTAQPSEVGALQLADFII